MPRTLGNLLTVIKIRPNTINAIVENNTVPNAKGRTAKVTSFAYLKLYILEFYFT